MIRWSMVAVLLLGAAMLGGGLLLAGLDVDVDALAAVTSAALWIWPVLYVAASVAVIVDAVQRARRRDVGTLARGMVAVKLALIPFFTLNFVLATMLSLLSLMLGVLAFVTAGVLAAGTYLLMLPTSAYGVAALIRMRRDRVVGAGFFWSMLVLHLVFVVDIVASLVVAHRIRRLRATPLAAPDPAEWAAFARLQQRQP